MCGRGDRPTWKYLWFLLREDLCQLKIHLWRNSSHRCQLHCFVSNSAPFPRAERERGRNKWSTWCIVNGYALPIPVSVQRPCSVHLFRLSSWIEWSVPPLQGWYPLASLPLCGSCHDSHFRTALYLPTRNPLTLRYKCIMWNTCTHLPHALTSLEHTG